MKQQTIGKTVSTKGIGLHTGQTTSISLHPAHINHGIKFKRMDTEKPILFQVDPNKIASFNRSTCLQSGEYTLHTVEHLLSALAASAIDNVLVEVTGPEIPILDGSSKEWMKLLKKAKQKTLEKDREYLIIEEALEYKDEATGAEYIALPYDGLSISALLDYDTATLNGQYACMNNLEDYEQQIAPCRTFVLLSELEKLAKTGLIKGGNLDNAIVYADKKMSKKALLQLAKKLGKSEEDFAINSTILNTKKLQFSNEAARHKILDLLGDLTLINKPLSLIHI